MIRFKNIYVTALAVVLTNPAQAQDVFKEMSYSPEQTVFRLNSPSCGVVRIYENGQGGNAIKVAKLKKVAPTEWTVRLKGDWKGKFYTFDIGRGETPGIFAKAVGVNGKRGYIADLKDTDPVGWDKDQHPKTLSPADLVIYEMHWRDFSIDPSSGLKYRGKFLSLTEPKAIEHLKNLGINAVHILPSFDYASVDEAQLDKPQYNWGYDPLNYNVPEGSYSTNPFEPTCRIKEFKLMVKALHEAGIRVILDVVYNHTFDLENSNFQKTYPNYYYRYNPDGSPSNGSGCGNETASDQPLMREFMLESVKYWVDEYHIDGFRFDLMGVHDIPTMNAIREQLNAIDPSLFIYGEGWSAGHCTYPSEMLATKANIPQLSGIAAFGDDMRDALRGPFSDDTQGAFLAGYPGEEESLKFGIVGGIDHPQVDMSKVNYDKTAWAKEPTQHISYVSCHDDMCLVDRLKAEIPQISTEELIRLDELAQTAVLTSQGVPFILSGEEMLRDKKGVHNSFNSPDSVNHLDWNNLKKYPQVFNYYSNLISLRKNHPAFRLSKAELVREHLSFLPVQKCLVAFQLSNHAGGDSWNNIIVILNANREAKLVDIPQGKYTVVCCDGQIDERGLGTVEGGKIEVDPQTALILHD
jgi:pullulanase